MELEIYKKSDFYEDYIDSQKEYYERENADAYFAERLAEKDKELCRHKYKRCLAMAWWCSAELGMLVSTWESKIKYYKRWQKRWLALAEQFKETK